MLGKTVRLCTFAALSLFACAARADVEGVPKYDHIFVIILENHGLDLIIGKRDNAPNINRLAGKYGLAAHYYGVTHPSKPNYIAMIAGDTFNIQDDDSYENRTLTDRSLIDQLKEKDLTWKGYYQSIPAPGSTVVNSPDDHHPLYASKHNAFINFASGQALSQNFVGFKELADDLASGQLPNYAHIVPDQCHDMHGFTGAQTPAECRKGSDAVIKQGDKTVDEWVTKIMTAAFWNAPGNNAIVITWDEDHREDFKGDGCCGFEPNSAANFGGGQVATIVITNNGPGHIVDDAQYNHYSLLRTTEAAFGITQFLKFADAADKGVKTMAKLFAVK